MADVADELKGIPLFSSLSQRQLKRLARDFKRRTVRPGTAIVRQGQMSGIGFFIVTDGVASVEIDGVEVASVGPGEHFGELGLISERARTATVTAATALECFEVTSWDFRRFVTENPDVAWKVMRHLTDLLVEAERRPTPG